MLGLSFGGFVVAVCLFLVSWLPDLVTHLFLWRHTALFFKLGKTLPGNNYFLSVKTFSTLASFYPSEKNIQSNGTCSFKSN